MKKIFSMLLVLAMLLACCAFAETAEAQLVESQTGLFTMEVPAGYLVMNSELAGLMLNSTDEDALAEYFDGQGIDGSMFMDARDNYDFANFEGRDMIIGPDIASNMNTTVAPNSGLDMAALAALGDMLGAQLIEMYGSLGIPAEACSIEGLLTFGANDYFAFFVNAGEMAMHQYMVINDEGSMITFTFVGFDPAAEESILASVVLK